MKLFDYSSSRSLISTLIVCVTSFSILSSCTEEDALLGVSDDSITPVSGTIAFKNFSVLTADIEPAVYNVANDTFTSTDVQISVRIGDRDNRRLTDAHTVFFEAEYGLIEPSCVTENGTCSVTWTADKKPSPGGPGSDGFVDITAYTIGEESFIDTNGNGTFDDGETFTDIEEPYVDNDNNNSFTAGDTIIDVISTLDATGSNAIHESGDMAFNGTGCTHTTACSSRTSVTVWDQTQMNIYIQAYSVGGNITGAALAVNDIVTLTLNGTEALDVTITGTSTPFTFATLLADTDTYDATFTATTSAGSGVCNVTNGMGTMGTANVNTIAVDCP